jgi:pimeloyl-ACP methyl ester carboxylesterase
MRPVRSVLIPLLLCCATFWSSGCATQILLHPETAREAVAQRPVDPAARGDVSELITVTNRFGHRLRGWLFSSPTNHGVVLVGDGNATGIAHTYDYNRYLLHQGFNVLILSHQGFDTNEGHADVKSLAGDVETFYSFCQAKFPNQQIALVAESISTAPFFGCASRHPEIAGMVLEALVNPKTIALAKANDWWLIYPIYPATFCFTFLMSMSVPNDLDVQCALKRHPAVPALFLHHPRDRITPYRVARRIFEQYAGEKEWITLQTKDTWPAHMNAGSDPKVTREVLRFLKQTLAPIAPPRESGRPGP